MRFPIIKRSALWVSIGLVWMALCLFLFFSNLRLSKQFTGGIEFKLDGSGSSAMIQKDIETKLSDTNLNVSTHEDKGITTILVQQDKEDENKLLEHSKTLQTMYANKFKEFAIVGPSIGKQVSSTAVQAIVRGLVLMAIFIVFEFSKIRKHIQPWILAVITVFTMLFDVLSPMGIYGINMMINHTTQLDVIAIIAILTTMGYSINDTIIIFDRVREHLEKDKNRNMADIFENSLRETMARSLMTSGIVLVTVICMYIFGTGDLKHFAFVMIFGVISGSASSIFLASPLAYLIIKYTNGKK